MGWRRRLRCSFCGKGEAEVVMLVAGPRVFICDSCVAEAHHIMESYADPDPPLYPPERGFWRRSWLAIRPKLNLSATTSIP